MSADIHWPTATDTSEQAAGLEQTGHAKEAQMRIALDHRQELAGSNQIPQTDDASNRHGVATPFSGVPSPGALHCSESASRQCSKTSGTPADLPKSRLKKKGRTALKGRPKSSAARPPKNTAK